MTSSEGRLGQDKFPAKVEPTPSTAPVAGSFRVPPCEGRVTISTTSSLWFEVSLKSRPASLRVEVEVDPPEVEVELDGVSTP